MRPPILGPKTLSAIDACLDMVFACETKDAALMEKLRAVRNEARANPTGSYHLAAEIDPMLEDFMRRGHEHLEGTG
jgi:hypothetical protein